MDRWYVVGVVVTQQDRLEETAAASYTASRHVVSFVAHLGSGSASITPRSSKQMK